MPEKYFRVRPEFNPIYVKYPDSTPISQVEPIEEPGVEIKNSRDLEKVVEYPLLEACQILRDKGINTVFSSANKKDIQMGYCHIAIEFDSLSPKNKEVAAEIGEHGNLHGSVNRGGIYLKIPLNQDSTVGEIKQKAIELVSRFETQNEKQP
jgi:hypothetical protein